MRQPNEKRDDLAPPFAAYLPALAAVAVMLIGFASTLMMLQLDVLQPKVGDMVVFRPGSQDNDAWQLEVAADKVAGRSAQQGACLLNPTVIARQGGSLVVEQRGLDGDRLYRLHWAGHQTADGAGDCGTTADLTLSRTDLQKLANAAGGFGVGDKGVVW
jgi:hypothetical protein